MSAPEAWASGEDVFAIRGARCLVDAREKADGEMRGEGAELLSGHINVYPAASVGAGTTRKERDVTAVCRLWK